VTNSEVVCAKRRSAVIDIDVRFALEDRFQPAAQIFSAAEPDIGGVVRDPVAGSSSGNVAAVEVARTKLLEDPSRVVSRNRR
jgi:hypothetical protein